MDYGLFRTFEKIGPSSLPRTVQERGLFLLELRSCLEKETRSTPVTWQVGRSAFGEVTRLELDRASTHLDVDACRRDESLLSGIQPPVRLAYNAESDTLAFLLLDQAPARSHTARGALIFSPTQDLVTALVHIGG